MGAAWQRSHQFSNFRQASAVTMENVLMMKWKKVVFLSVSIVFLSFHTSNVFSESLEDGLLTRADIPVVLKNGTVVPCESLLWLTQAADFLQCDQGGTCKEIKIEDIHLEKTFGPAIAREYEASKAQLKDAYAEEEKKRRENVVSYENRPTVNADEDPKAPAPEPSSKGKDNADDRDLKPGSQSEKKREYRVKLTPERERELRAELKRCEEHLKRVQSRDHDTIPYADQIKLMKNGAVEMTPEEFWKRTMDGIEGRCNRIKLRLQGKIVQEPRSVRTF